MPTFQFEAMDSTGAEIKDVIDAPTEEEAQATDTADGVLRHEDLRQEEPQGGSR